MRPTYKFESMFRGKQVIIEYEIDRLGDIDVAIISDNTPNFIHPNYEKCDDFLDEYHWEVYQLAKDHVSKVNAAKATSVFNL